MPKEVSKMCKPLWSFIFLLATFPAFSQEIAITIDDVPRTDSNLFTGEERTNKIIANLKMAKAPEILLFVTTKNITKKSKKRIDAYTDAGHYLGNHSHNHFSAHKVGVETYLSDIELASKELKSFDNVLPFYRYPYLHEGKDRSTRDHIRLYLKSQSYLNGYATVDNYDWYMDSLLQKALAEGKKVDYEALKKVYIRVLWEAVLFYDDIARKSLGKSPKHVLLLHENDMAALFIGDLVEYIRSQGWKVISPQEAYKDSISYMAPDVLFNKQGRIAAIAKSKGWSEQLLRSKAESQTYLDEYFEANGVFE